MQDRSQYVGTLPLASARYRPKADANALSGAVQTAWHHYNATQFPRAEKAAIAEAAAAHIERLHPAADMAVLKRYDKTEQTDHAYVRYFNARSGRWDDSVSFQLPRTVTCADGGSSLYQGGVTGVPQHADKRFPAEWNEYFARLGRIRAEYRFEYSAATKWPAEYKAKHDIYPLWSEIETRFPVTGNWIADRRRLVSPPPHPTAISPTAATPN